MLSFAIDLNLENELKNLQGELVELCKTFETLPPDEAGFLHCFAL